MARVYLSLGSNINRQVYITAGLDALKNSLGNWSSPQCMKVKLWVLREKISTTWWWELKRN